MDPRLRPRPERRYLAAGRKGLCACLLALHAAGAGFAQDGAAVAPQEPAPDIATLFEGALLDTRNGQDVRETSGYRKLLEQVALYSAEDFSARATERLDYDAAMKDPDRFRGRLVTVRGLIQLLRTKKLNTPVLGRGDVIRGIVTETDQTEVVLFDLPDRPEGGLRFGRDLVDLEGVFYRTARYEDEDGQIRELPYLIARNLRPADLQGAKRSRTPDLMVLVIVGSAVVYFGFRVLVIVRDRNKRYGRRRGSREPTIRELFKETSRAGRGRGPSGSGGEPPGTPPNPQNVH